MLDNGEMMTSYERIDVIKNLLDKLLDAQGRAKCGYILAIDDFLNKIKEDIEIKNAQIDDLLKIANKNETESQE